MITNKKLYLYLNLTLKASLGIAFTVTCISQIWAGDVFFSVLALGMAGIFIKEVGDSYFEMKSNDLVKNDEKPVHNMLSTKKNEASCSLCQLEAHSKLDFDVPEQRKSRGKSEPKHNIPPLKLLAKTAPLTHIEPSHQSQTKLESTPNYVPFHMPLSKTNKRSPKRFSQRPLPEAIESAREMTEEELEKLMNTQTPKSARDKK